MMLKASSIVLLASLGRIAAFSIDPAGTSPTGWCLACDHFTRTAVLDALQCTATPHCSMLERYPQQWSGRVLSFLMRRVRRH